MSLTCPGQDRQVYFSYRLHDRHELFFGPCFQNYRHESVTANAYTPDSWIRGHYAATERGSGDLPLPAVRRSLVLHFMQNVTGEFLAMAQEAPPIRLALEIGLALAVIA